ncbi:MAG: ATPase [Erysipelotrichia bacterium]|nr:ATPase [Erysipelotrichia bacterium]
MLTLFEILIPAIMIAVIILPLIKVFKGETSVASARKRLATHVTMFFTSIAASLMFMMSNVSAAEEAVTSVVGTNAQGMGFLAAALATGIGSLGAGIAVAAAAPAAIGAFSENDKNFSKAMIFVAMGEGVAIYGLLISILIINKL